MPASYPVLRLRKGKERSVKNKHPWIFSGALHPEPSGVKDGDLVTVITEDGETIATGFFHKSTITVRCLAFEKVEIDAGFWQDKFQSAWHYRKTIGLVNNSATNAFRLIHGEGDGLPGLVIDYYDGICVLQLYTAGMYAQRDSIVNALQSVQGMPIKAIFDKSGETLSRYRPEGGNDGFIYRQKEPLPEYVLENNIRFRVDYEGGQKTGFFLDQRDNRSLVKQYAAGKKVLNTFSYTGGFSLYALAAGASLVHSVDSSKRAIEGIEANIELNDFSTHLHQGFAMDVMTFLKSGTEQYDLIILDPPAYAKHLSQAKQAMIGYRNLNTEGIRKIQPGGILFTFSCSQVIDRELFRKIIFQSALQAGRNVRIMHQLSQPPDHPVNIYHPEAEYLKGLVVYVE
jgi:23S rRNA (cytosine1962-C5)-methyltransferase